jgi:hypothetical protein
VSRAFLVRACGLPPDARLARNLLHLDLSRKPGDVKLDSRPSKLGEPEDPVGVFTCRERSDYFPRPLRGDGIPCHERRTVVTCRRVDHSTPFVPVNG